MRTLAHSDARVFFLDSIQNGGVAHSRNKGVDAALALWPQLDSILFLDSDDRLDDGCLQNFQDALDAARRSPQHNERARIGWVYTNPYQFGGVHGFMSKVESYSVLWHMLANINSVTSLIDADLFRAGHRFDLTMTAGSEDWDFWLGAVELGYQGRFITGPTFAYRRRPESTVTGAMRRGGEIAAYIRQKRPRLFKNQAILHREHHENPRYASMSLRSDTVCVWTDPTRRNGREVDLREMIRSLQAAQDNHLIFAPRYVISTQDAAVLGRIEAAGVLSSVLWLSERLADKHGVVGWAVSAASVERAEARAGIDLRFDTPVKGLGAFSHCAAVFAAGRMVLERKRPGDIANIHIVLRGRDEGPDAARAPIGGDALLQRLHHAVEVGGGEIRRQRYRRDTAVWVPKQTSAAELVDRLAGVKRMFPGMNQGRTITIVMPPAPSRTDIDHVGDVARALRGDGGYQVRIGVFFNGRFEAEWMSDDRPGEIVLLPRDTFEPSGRARWHYLGAALSEWMIKGDRSEFLGLMGDSDAVVSWAMPETVAAFGSLKLRGVAGLSALPAYVIRGAPDAASWAKGATLAYEHACARILVGSEKDRSQLAALGVPPSKVAVFPYLNYQRHSRDAVVEEQLRAAWDPQAAAARLSALAEAAIEELAP